MRKALATLAVGTILLAAPALAQIGVDVGARTGANVGGTLGNTVGGVTDRLGSTVDRVDGTVNQAIDTTNLSLAAREDIRAGADLRYADGSSVGTVQSVEGDVAIVIRGGKLYNVPLSEIYRDTSGKTRGLVTRLSRAEVKVRGDVSASAN